MERRLKSIFQLRGAFMLLKKDRFIKAIFILMIATFTIAGCGGRLFTYKGDKVTQKDLMVQLMDGNQQGVWKTNEVAIKYQYRMTPETLTFAGTIELVGGFKYFSRLAVQLLFLDDQGIVIENKLIYSAGNYRPIVSIPMDFEKTIPIPDGARTISFAYDLSSVHGK